jgi:antirestriction protein ArdC
VPAPLEPPIAPITGDTLAWTLPVLEALAGELDVTVAREPLAEGHDGYYQPQERRIAINAAVSVNQQTAALAHELAHALVRRDHHDDDPELDYATEELVAESVVFTVCGFLGLDTAGNSIAYLAVWRESTEADAFERIAALVDRLARRLEDALQPNATGDGAAEAAVNTTE